MARIPTASRDTVPQDQAAAFDEYVAAAGQHPRYRAPLGHAARAGADQDAASTCGPICGATSPACPPTSESWGCS